MVVDIKSHLAGLLRQALASLAPDQAEIEILLERSKQPAHGDFASNLALQLAKPLKRSPREIAGLLIAELPRSALIARAEVAGAGFINFFVAGDTKTAAVRTALREGAKFGHVDIGRGSKVQIEFVSANPTGPLHVGHGRGAAYGSALANVLAATGHVVTREFYVNDAGRQMDILATSVWLRYLEQRGETPEFPAEGYRGDYVRDIAALLGEQQGARLARDAALLPKAKQGEDAEAALDALVARVKSLLGEDWWTVHRFALDAMLADQRNDLGQFRVHFDVWYSEQSLFANGSVERVVERLRRAGHLYEQDGALWFRSTAFGDEKDRVIRRDNGAYTYFASDIAYHAEKFGRGFERVIDVWGADHHGYIARVKGALAALGIDPGRLDVALVQFAVLYRGGEKTAMGKRSGEFVTLRDLRREVGDDAARLFYVLRKSDQHLDFDLDLAKSESNENPVYYIQYAHARVCSVLAQWGGLPGELAEADLAPLTGERELALAARIAAFPDVLEAAARDYAPHLVAFYLKDLAADLHSFYNAERILVEAPGIRDARLALVAAVRQTLANGLALLGVSAPETM